MISQPEVDEQDGPARSPTRPVGCALLVLVFCSSMLWLLPRLGGYAVLRYECGRDRGLLTWVAAGFPSRTANSTWAAEDLCARYQHRPQQRSTPEPRTSADPGG